MNAGAWALLGAGLAGWTKAGARLLVSAALCCGQVRPSAAGTARRATTRVLGIQVPAAFWDPLEISADGDVALFKSRRAASVVHGRMCMIACAYELGCRQFSKNFAAFVDMPGDLQSCMAEFLGVCELFSRKFGWQNKIQPVEGCTASKSDLVAGRLGLMAVSCLCCQEALADSFVSFEPA